MTDTQIATQTIQPLSGKVMEDVLARGDLSKLSAEDRVVYYNTVCQTVGLNPVTRPFLYITYQGKLVLYATRDCADQLRKINGINIEIADRTVHDGLLTVHVRAIDKTGRRDEDFGAVAIMGMKGEAAANAMMKAVTKAKRRVTLSISGLGFLDETEIEDAERHQHVFTHLAAKEDLPKIEPLEAPPAPPSHDPETGETGPRILPVGGDGWRPWAQTLIACVRNAASSDEVDEWIARNDDMMLNMREEEPKMYKLLTTAIDEAKKAHAG